MSKATATATDGDGDRDETALAASEIRERIQTLHNLDASTATNNVPDIVRFGNPDAWQLICKASSAAEGWMKSTKALETTQGCLVQVTTHQRNHDGTNALAESVTFVPGLRIIGEPNARRLI